MHSSVERGSEGSMSNFPQEQEAPDASDTFIYLYNKFSARPCARNTQLPQADCPLVVSGLQHEELTTIVVPESQHCPHSAGRGP